MALKLNITDVILFFIKSIFHFYDIITLPIYALIQKPWISYSKSRAVRAKQLNPKDPYSPWVGLAQPSNTFADHCKTVDEMIKKAIKVNGVNKKCLGFREVIREETEYSEGKPFTKCVLNDYKWITYGMLDERVDRIGRGLLLNGVKSGDIVMIFADTSIEWFVCLHSLLRIGGTIATLYTNCNDQGYPLFDI